MVNEQGPELAMFIIIELCKITQEKLRAEFLRYILVIERENKVQVHFVICAEVTLPLRTACLAEKELDKPLPQQLIQKAKRKKISSFGAPNLDTLERAHVSRRLKVNATVDSQRKVPTSRTFGS